jgi:ribose transport system ATP-binding protein
MNLDTRDQGAASANGRDPEALVEFRGVSKSFPGVNAVVDVSLVVRRGEVHGLAGENGAGKSTLIGLLAQRERVTSGEILLDGQPMGYHGPNHAQRLGVSIVYQEMALFPHLSVADNLFIGRERSRFSISRKNEQTQARELLARVGLSVDPRHLVSTLSVAEQQLVEIAKALAVDSRVVVMDEPTAVLSAEEIPALFRVVETLKAQGIAVVYVTHRLEELFALTDRITVMRDAHLVATRETADLTEKELVRLMVGRDLTKLYDKPEVTPGDVLLEATGLSRKNQLYDCSISVRAGEIVGLAGIVGAGRSEFARALFGAEPADAGTVRLAGKKVHIRTPRAAMKHGLMYLTEDRKRDGILPNRSIAENISLAKMPGPGPFLNLKDEARLARAHVEGLRIRTKTIRRHIRTLSGGNQQKALVARALQTNTNVLIFDEPARGIDIAAKAEVFALIGQLASQGKAVILISSYLPELLNMCDRILVMKDGRVVGELTQDEFSEERIAELATKGGWTS